MTAPTLTMIPASSLIAGENDRSVFDAEALNDLAASIDANGLAQPPTVRPLPDGMHEIVAGERRCRAMRDILGWEQIPVVVRELSDEQAEALMLAENVARADLNPLDEARAYQRRIDRYGISQADLAAQVGVPRQTVYRRLQLLRLRPEIAEMVANGQLDQSFGTPMGVLDWDRQMLALRTLNAGSLDLFAFRALIDRLQVDQNAEPVFDAESFWSVEEYAARARSEAKVSQKEQLRRMVARLAVAVEPHDPSLAGEARKLVA